MSLGKESESVREAVAVFDTAQTLQYALDELLSSGFHRADLSLLAREEDVASKLGHRYRKASKLEVSDQENRAVQILKRHSGRDVHVH